MEFKIYCTVTVFELDQTTQAGPTVFSQPFNINADLSVVSTIIFIRVYTPVCHILLIIE